MKNLLLLVMLALTSVITQAATYYVSPTGSDSNPGTILSPFKTLTKASTVLAALPSKGAGDIVYVRGGTYGGWPNTPTNGYAYMLLNNLKGTASNPVTFINYPGEKPVFDFTGVVITSTRPSPTGVSIFNSNYLNFKGMRFTGLKQITNGSGVSRGLELNNCTWCVIEQVEIDHFQGTAFFGSGSVFDCTFKNCDAHHNDDRLSADGSGVPGSDAWDNADGFGFTGAGNTSDRITFDGCRAWLNCDDGWDNFGTNGSRIWKNCWAFWNGYYQDPGMATKQPAGNGQGFKLGPCGSDMTGVDNLRVLQNCIGFENRANGFDQNGSTTTRMKMLNCTAYGNGSYGFQFQYYASSPGTILHTLRNNASLGNGAGAVNLASAAPTNISNNSWNGTVSISNADFQSVSSIGADGPRQADGSLPVLTYLKLSSNSDLINAGINVGLPFLSSLPDIGAYESNGTLINVPPIASAGADQTITLPTNSVSLTGSGTDVGGSISAYAWTKLSGPTGGTITSATTASTTLTGLAQGVYQFELKVTDNNGATATDVMQVIVNASTTNIAPIANAGADKTITLPTNTSSITGTGTDANGTIASYLWTKVAGPTTGTITTATAATTALTALVAGTYKFELKVTDNGGAVGRDTMQLTVNSATTNTPPVANAGVDQTIVLPTSAVTLTGTGTDANGTIATYAWTKASGPTAGTITNAAAASTTVTGLVQGTYKFALKVTDNGGATATDTVQVIVNPTAAATKIIRVNIYGGTTIYNHAAWNNWKPVSSTASSNFKYSDGTTSTVNATISRQSSIVDNGASYLLTATICPPPVLRFASAYASTRTLSIKGLDPARLYSFDFYGSSTASGNQTGYTINGVTRKFSTYNNKLYVAQYNNIAPNSSGTVTVTLTTTGSMNYLNGFTVIEQTGTVAGREMMSDAITDEGTEADSNASVSVFPLPFSTSFTVNLHGEATGTYQLILIDPSGKTVWKKEINKTGASLNETIYMGNLSSGAYILQVIDPEKNKSAHTIIKN